MLLYLSAHSHSELAPFQMHTQLPDEWRVQRSLPANLFHRQAFAAGHSCAIW